MIADRLIVRLIEQDMKHHLLVSGLEKLDLELKRKHHLELLEIVSELMGIQPHDLHDQWITIYAAFLRDSTMIQPATQEKIKNHAEKCFVTLSAYKKYLDSMETLSEQPFQKRPENAAQSP